MARIILNYLLPLLLPIFLYLVWIYILRQRSKRTKSEAPSIGSIGIFSSIVTGILLMMLSIIVVAILGGSPPGKGDYQSPRYENGKIIPPKLN